MSTKLMNVKVEHMDGHGNEYYVRIWASRGMESIIRGVEGVARVSETLANMYSVDIDHRYDPQSVIDSIVTAVEEATK